ncbi:MAG: hypothetical protein ACT4O5_03655 [Gammaproteobacteria bacterium]
MMHRAAVHLRYTHDGRHDRRVPRYASLANRTVQLLDGKMVGCEAHHGASACALQSR